MLPLEVKRSVIALPYKKLGLNVICRNAAYREHRDRNVVTEVNR